MCVMLVNMCIMLDVWNLQKQPELHKVQPPEPGETEAKDGGSSSKTDKDKVIDEEDEKPSSSNMEERWPAVKAAQANEPVGIITIEDVLEELIGTVCTHLQCNVEVHTILLRARGTTIYCHTQKLSQNRVIFLALF